MLGSLILSFVLAATADSTPMLVFPGDAEVVQPGLVSTANTEIRITFSPDGTRMLWGTIGWEGGPGGWDIWESVMSDGTWQPAHPASFDCSFKDFDPFFARDGSGVYFFSDRPGGEGGDDVWFAPFDAATGKYGSPSNLGPNINSKGDEWAPTLSADGRKLLFATDGRGGAGLHDLFVSERANGAWKEARALPAPVNSEQDDFDAAWLHDGTSLVFSRKPKDKDEMSLYVTFERNGKWTAPVKLGLAVNVIGGWNMGPSINPSEPSVLYFTSHREGASQGRLDLYKIRYQAGAPGH